MREREELRRRERETEEESGYNEKQGRGRRLVKGGEPGKGGVIYEKGSNATKG